MIFIPLILCDVILLVRKRTLLVAIACFSATEIATQILGRSLIKLVIDLGFYFTLIGNHIINHLYGYQDVQGSNKNILPILHSEVLGILRISVNICLFVVGTLGISIASNFLSRYFTGELAQGTTWAYFGGIIYLSGGMYWLLILPLYKTLINIRERIAEF